MYAPGSFTRNFGWHGRGLRKLHETIRAGFSGRAEVTSREDWRKRSGIIDANISLLPVNFYLNNRGADVVPDELVLRALAEEHSRDWDRLALFALNLSNVGSPTDAEWHPIRWANEFVRERLYQGDRWQADALDLSSLDAFITARVAGTSGRIKIRRNYRHLWELCGYLPASLPNINSGAERWLGSALFVAWDRYFPTRTPIEPDLVRLVVSEEIHKLLGLPAEEVAAVAPELARFYCALGGSDRTSAAAALPATALAPLTAAESTADEIVGRTLRTREEQIRNQALANSIKRMYEDRCCLCGTRLAIGNAKFYSEAAHIKPLGRPHNGPDTLANMIVLCPNHHKQFDRGAIRIASDRTGYVWHDLHAGTTMPIRLRHSLEPSCVEWHARWCEELVEP